MTLLIIYAVMAVIAVVCWAVGFYDYISEKKSSSKQPGLDDTTEE